MTSAASNRIQLQINLFCRQLWEREEHRRNGMVSLSSSSKSSPNFLNQLHFSSSPFISALRPPLSVKYIGLTVSRGFNGAIKPSILKPQISFTVGFGSSVDRYGRTPAALKTWKHSPLSPPTFTTPQNVPKFPKRAQNLVLWDVSCRYAQTSQLPPHKT